MTDRSLALATLDLAAEAAEAIMHHYRRGGEVRAKADDSPVTAADLASQAVLLEGLGQLTPGVPVISEEQENAPASERHHWDTAWLVDPLDGTKEYIAGTGEFAICLALIQGGRPVLGAIFAPTQGLGWVGGQGLAGIRRERGAISRLQPKSTPAPARIVTSSRQHSEALDRCLSRMDAHFGGIERQMLGSALKFAAIAEGRCDAYPRFGKTSEWDTAAGQALLESVGGLVIGADGEPLRYNQRDSLINPAFIAAADSSQPWRKLFAPNEQATA